MQPLEEHDPLHIGEYELLGRLGGGGMGRVYLGRSPAGRRVAVKVVNEGLARDPEFRERFRNELVAAGRVHAFYTAAVLRADPDAPQPWMATAYIQGPSLQQRVHENGPLSPAELAELAAGVAEALTEIHAAGIVHRDLKPSNVMLSPDGPRVIDFGVARAAEGATNTATGTFTGSAIFMSPEQAQGLEVGPATDVFSLATMLFWAATGRPAFGTGQLPAVMYRVVHQEPDLDAVTDPGLRSLIAGCLAKQPADRPSAAQVLAQAAQLLNPDAAADPPSPARTPVPVPPVLPPFQPPFQPAAEQRPTPPYRPPAETLASEHTDIRPGAARPDPARGPVVRPADSYDPADTDTIVRAPIIAADEPGWSRRALLLGSGAAALAVILVAAGVTVLLRHPHEHAATVADHPTPSATAPLVALTTPTATPTPTPTPSATRKPKPKPKKTVTPAGPSGPRTGALLLADSFGGRNGAGWGPDWALGRNPDSGQGGGAVLHDGEGRLATSDLGNVGPARVARRANIAAVANVDVRFSFRFDATGCFPLLIVRGNNLLDTKDGDGLGISQDGSYSIARDDDYTLTGPFPNLSTGRTSVGLTFTRHTLYDVHLAAEGHDIYATIWPASRPEPTRWALHVHDPAKVVAGATGFSVGSGVQKSPSYFYVDNVRIHRITGP